MGFLLDILLQGIFDTLLDGLLRKHRTLTLVIIAVFVASLLVWAIWFKQ